MRASGFKTIPAVARRCRHYWCVDFLATMEPPQLKGCPVCPPREPANHFASEADLQAPHGTSSSRPARIFWSATLSYEQQRHQLNGRGSRGCAHKIPSVLDRSRRVALFQVGAIDRVLDALTSRAHGADRDLAMDYLDTSARLLQKRPVPASRLQAPQSHEDAVVHHDTQMPITRCVPLPARMRRPLLSRMWPAGRRRNVFDFMHALASSPALSPARGPRNCIIVAQRTTPGNSRCLEPRNT